MVEYFLGLDLGQAQDFTALAVLEAKYQVRDDKWARTYACRHLSRWPLGTRYVQIAADMRDLLERPPQRLPPQDPPPLMGSVLTVDATGAGAPVVEILR